MPLRKRPALQGAARSRWAAVASRPWTCTRTAPCRPCLTSSKARNSRHRRAGSLKGTFPVEAARVADMDKDGIGVQVLSINAFWYAADRDLARRMFDLQSEKLAEMCRAIPGRFLGYGPVSLQFPELAAEQLEHRMKHLGLVGAAIGGNVEGEEIAASKFDPFWKKAEELQALVFIHPQTAPQSTGISNRIQGSGALGNVIGNP